MASKTFSAVIAPAPDYSIRLFLSSTTNISGNYSDVAYTFQFGTDWTGAGYHFRSKNRVYLEINGSVIVDTANIGDINLNGGGWYTLASGTIRVPHNSDGTKSISVSGTFNQTQSTGFSATVGGTFTLDTIPRTSKPTVSASSVALGGSITIYTNRASASFTHELTYSIGSASGTLASGVGDSYTWSSIAKDFAHQFPNSPSGTVTITCRTYSGGTLIGTETTSFSVTLAGDMIPTCSLAVEEAAELPEGITGYIKSRSRLKITASAAGVYGSSIKAYKIEANGSTYHSASAVTGVLSSDGANKIKLTVTDSRNQPNTAEVEITVTDYASPVLYSLSAFRCASATDDTESETGGFIAAEFSGSITALGNANTKQCNVYYKKTTDADTAWQTVSVPLDDYAFNQSVIFEADPDYAYNIRVELKDSFSSSDYYHDVGSGFTLVDIKNNNHGWAFGKVAEVDGLDINMDVYFRKSIMTPLSLMGDDQSIKFHFGSSADATASLYESASGTLQASGGFNVGGDLNTYGYNLVLNGGTGKSAILRRDGTDFYILLSDDGGGSAWNSKRPFRINLSSGNVYISETGDTVYIGSAENGQHNTVIRSGYYNPLEVYGGHGSGESSIAYINRGTKYWAVGAGAGTTGSGCFSWWYYPSSRVVAGLDNTYGFEVRQYLHLGLWGSTSTSNSWGGTIRFNGIGNKFPCIGFADTDCIKMAFSDYVRCYFSNAGNFFTIGSFQNGSDRRMKKNILQLDEKYDDFVEALNPVHFNWKENTADHKIHYGFIAQEIMEIYEKLGMDYNDYGVIDYQKDTNRYSLSYSEFIPMIVSYEKNTRYQVSELQRRVDELEKELSAMKNGGNAA